MYGIPQPNTYGQYGFGGYGGFPSQAAGAAGAPTSANPGMSQAAAAGGGGAGLGLGAGVGQAGGDPNAAAAGQAGQAQWGGADPSSYYSNYWGGMFSCLLRRIVYSTVLQVIMDNRQLASRALAMFRCRVHHKRIKFYSSEILILLSLLRTSS
jgi:hypothetical protein